MSTNMKRTLMRLSRPMLPTKVCTTVSIPGRWPRRSYRLGPPGVDADPEDEEERVASEPEAHATRRARSGVQRRMRDGRQPSTRGFAPCTEGRIGRLARSGVGVGQVSRPEDRDGAADDQPLDCCFGMSARHSRGGERRGPGVLELRIATPVRARTGGIRCGHGEEQQHGSEQEQASDAPRAMRPPRLNGRQGCHAFASSRP